MFPMQAEIAQQQAEANLINSQGKAVPILEPIKTGGKFERTVVTNWFKRARVSYISFRGEIPAERRDSLMIVMSTKIPDAHDRLAPDTTFESLDEMRDWILDNCCAPTEDEYSRLRANFCSKDRGPSRKQSLSLNWNGSAEMTFPAFIQSNAFSFNQAIKVSGKTSSFPSRDIRQPRPTPYTSHPTCSTCNKRHVGICRYSNSGSLPRHEQRPEQRQDQRHNQRHGAVPASVRSSVPQPPPPPHPKQVSGYKHTNRIISKTPCMFQCDESVSQSTNRWMQFY